VRSIARIRRMRKAYIFFRKNVKEGRIWETYVCVESCVMLRRMLKEWNLGDIRMCRELCHAETDVKEGRIWETYVCVESCVMLRRM
jgi:hypothetical protein